MQPEQRRPAGVEDLAREVLHAHGTTSHTLTLLGDAENVTYRVATPTGPRLLRLTPPGRRTLDEMTAELAWLHALRRDTALTVPTPLSFPNGDLARTFDTPDGAWLAVIFAWVNGEFRADRLTAQDTAAVGQLSAALHAHADTFTLPTGLQRPHLRHDPAFVGWDDLLVRRADLTGAERGAIRHAVRMAHHALDAAQRAGVRTHLLHGDLHQGNYLFTPHGVAAIDFDDCQFGPALYDLAATLAHLSLPDRDGTLRAAFLDGYEATRPLQPRERELLPAFVTLRHLWMLRWILERDHDPAFAAWAPDYRAWQLGELLAGQTAVPHHP